MASTATLDSSIIRWFMRTARRSAACGTRLCVGGHPLGLFAGAGLTQPVRTSDANSFGGKLSMFPFRSNFISSFVLRILSYPVKNRTWQ